MFLGTLKSALLIDGLAVLPGWTIATIILLCAALWMSVRLYRCRKDGLAAQAVNHMDQGAAVVDRDGRIQFANPAFSNLLMTAQGSGARSQPLSDLDKARGLNEAIQTILDACAGSPEGATEHVLSDNTILNAKVSAFGEARHLVILRDVTSWRTSEADVAGRLNELQDELKRSHRELENFTHVASHDLKEPLRGLTINANFLMREDGLSELGKDRVTRMVALCHRMEQLISDLLFFSRLSWSGKSLEDVDPVQIITALRVSLTEVLDERDGTISIATELPLVHAESAKIKTVFQNLIVNGVKYNDALRKVVTVGFKPSVEIGNQAYQDMFYVSDNGIGISEGNREKIFGIFSRLNSEKAYGAGTGAGLAFVKKIVEDYGGEITFQSRPGQGTTFYFSLPIARHADAPPLRPVRKVAG